jgi:putative membrane protein
MHAAWLRRLKLGSAELARIKEAVEKAEAECGGEIAVALTGESADYAFWELFTALIAGALTFALLLPCSGALTSTLERLLWGASAPWHLPLVFGIVTFGVTALVYSLTNIPAIDRLIIPTAVRTETVHRRAMRYFAESGVYNTTSHSGILLFVSYMERTVCVIADSGIAKVIPQESWNAIVEGVTRGLNPKNAENVADVFVQAVARCAQLIGAHCPPEQKHGNELDNALALLEN